MGMKGKLVRPDMCVHTLKINIRSLREVRLRLRGVYFTEVLGFGDYSSRLEDIEEGEDER